MAKTDPSARRSALYYRIGAGVAIGTAFVTIWSTIVRDDGTGMGWFLIVMAAAVGAFAARLASAGMARAMLGTAIMQALFGLSIATAPTTAGLPDGGAGVLFSSGALTLLWLVAAVFFRAAARGSNAR
ncbi:MAG: hypothetical protein U0S50_04505 [Sphingopyxis sp.]|uniref:hypothetical protein n=1 Tax=Sphingopyxis sp. TaxID=1908224 RepID=UPI002AB90880|nr:hypothetical protein [Sphingopyxis sp.]MDZ3831062.1 hypothetical protein [Sphingopyxis sp.]